METAIVSSTIRSSKSMSPSSSPLISVRRALGVLPLQLDEVFANDLEDVPLVRKNAEIFPDVGQQPAVLFGQLLLLQVDQLAERHAENGVGLDGGEGIVFAASALRGEDFEALLAQGPLHQADGHWISISRSLASGWVDEVRITRITSSMLAWASNRPSTVCFRCRAWPEELGAAANHRQPVADELFQQALERQHPRLAVDQGQEDDREGVLQPRELVELVEHDFRVGVALQLQDQPHGLLQIALVADGGDAGDPPFVDQRGDPLFDAVAGLLVGNFVDHDAIAVLAVLFDVVRARTTTCRGRCDIRGGCPPGRKSRRRWESRDRARSPSARRWRRWARRSP